MSQQIVLNGGTSRIAPNEPIIINRTDRFQPPVINGFSDVTINGLTRHPTLSGCVLDLPLYLPTLQTSPFKSVDNNAQVCTVTGGALWTPKGRLYDGTTGIITVTDAASIQNITTKTMIAWIYPTGWGEGGGYGRIIVKMNAVGWAWYLYDAAHPNRMLYYNTFTGADGQWYSSANVNLNTWNCVGVTYDNSAVGNAPIFYIAGVPVAVTQSDVPTGTRDTDAGQNLTIGNNVATSGTFQGTIGEVQVYNQILSAAKIQNIYLATRWRYQ